MKAISFMVEGKGRFPFDMLRHDQCFPCDGWSAHNISVDTPDLRTVKLICISSTGITAARWASFGWFVDNDTTQVYNDYSS